MRRYLALLFAALLVAAGLTIMQHTPDATPAAASTTTKHYISNLGGSTAPFAIGYNVADTSYHPSVVNALPDGVQALVWLGQKCPTPIDSTFRARVDALRNNPKVFGFYLSDEPHISDCPGGPAALASRADYIRSTSPVHESFIVLSKDNDYTAFRPGVTHVDMIGLDPYPCSIANPQCDIAKIGQKVNSAVSKGIPLAQIVPVYQAFGQENTTSHYYNLPTVAQEQAMLAEWARLVPSPMMDYTYGWGHQSSSNPTLIDSPGLQQVFASHFAGTSQSC